MAPRPVSKSVPMAEWWSLCVVAALVAGLLAVATPAVSQTAPPAKDAAEPGYYVGQRGIMWTTHDNGGGRIDYYQAAAHCRAVRVGGWTDWRLPTVDELEIAVNTYVSAPEAEKAKIPLRITPGGLLLWSGSKQDEHHIWVVNYPLGYTYTVDPEYKVDHARAMCVRPAP